MAPPLTVASLAVREGLRVEGAGAVALAAMPVVSGQRRIALVSGGNIDEVLLAELLRPEACLPQSTPRTLRGGAWGAAQSPEGGEASPSL